MPTIDELAPATASSDTDEFLISQVGTALKVTRAQVLAGTQPALAVSSGVLLGRSSSGVGAPEQITIGSNLILSGGTLTADATPYVVGSLPSGSVPSLTDAIPLGQGGANVTVTYAQFMSSLPSVPSLDASAMLVTPAGATSAETMANFAANVLPTAGGAMTGALTLAADPAEPMQAATKGYVDDKAAVVLPMSGGTLTGPLVLAEAPTTNNQAATKQYVDVSTATALPLAGGALAGPLTLAADPAEALQAATKEYVDARVMRSGDTLTGPLVLAADPTVPLQAATKQYADAVAENVLPLAGGTLSGPLLLASDPGVSQQAATKHYVDNSVATALPVEGGALTGPLTLAADPTSALQAATKEYVDTRLLRSGDTLTGALTLAADPVNALQAATKQYVDSHIVTALPLAGGTMSGALTLSGTPGAPMQATPKQYVDAQIATALSLAGGLLSGALAIAGTTTLGGSGLNSLIVTPGSTSSTGITLTEGGTGGVNIILGPSDPLTIKGSSQLAASYINAGRGITSTLSGSSQAGTAIPLWVSANIAGASTAGSVVSNAFFVTSEASIAAPSALVSGVDIAFNTGGAAASSAGWQALYVNLGDGAPTNDKAGGGAGAWVALQVASRASQNQGGTGLTPSTAYGQRWGIDIVASLLPGATYQSLFNGLEINPSVQAGASVMRQAGIQLSRDAVDVGRGALWASAILVCDAEGHSTSNPWMVGLNFGGTTGQPAFGAGSELIAAQFGLNQVTEGYSVATGIDFLDPTFSRAAWISDGVSILGGGIIQIGTGYLSATSTGLAIDAKGSVGIGTPSVNAGGSGWANNDLADDGNDGVYSITAPSGVITAVTVLRQPHYNSISPPSTLTLTARAPSAGTGGILNGSWATTQTTLSLNPSGGPIQASLFTNAANDAAAASAGVGVGEFYRNGSVVMQRVS